jgi:D-alanyl-D-alanine carboxypeptidase/D-alanyl-D-alanine-endopeptidase (penicillin-binding protein 4)
LVVSDVFFEDDRKNTPPFALSFALNMMLTSNHGSAHAKTGTMSFVRGLAGYIDTAAGHRLAFAIFFNDAEKRAALEAAFDPHVRAIDARSRSWRNRAVTLERKLATGWAGRF